MRKVKKSKKPTKSARVQIQRALELAKSKDRRAAAAKVFSFPSHPKSATPENGGMAQDSAFKAINAWAVENVFNSAFEEGQAFLGYAFLSELAIRSEYRRPAEIIATEMTREWIELTSSGGDDNEKQSDKIAAITKRMEDLQVREHFKEASIHDSFFGRGHIFLDFGEDDAPDELQTPVGDGRSDVSKAKCSQNKPLKALRNVEPVWTYPTRYNSSNPLKSDWYKPENWQVNGITLHRSRLLTFIAREVPDLLKPAYSFGGLSLTQMLKPYVDNWLRTRQSISDLIHSFAILGIKIDMTTLLQEGAEAIFERTDLFNITRDNRNMMLLNKDTEEFFNVNIPLSGLADLQAQSQEQMACVPGIPLVKLFGIQPMGLNASSDGEIRVFYDWINAFQEFFYRPRLKVILDFVQLSLFGAVDENIGFTFKPLFALDEKQEAEKQKTEAETDVILIDAGVIDAEESRKRVASDPDTPYHGLDPNDVPEPPVEDDPENGEEPEEEGGRPTFKDAA